MIKLRTSKVKLYLGNKKIKKMYLGSTKVYSSGNIVTYVVDSGVTYSEEIDEGVSVLSPTTFTPSKSGWTFVGWRRDAAANGTVISSLVMGDDPITLYAVFRQTVTLTYYNGVTTASSTSGTRYYNNDNIVNPTFTISPAAMSGWSFRGWATRAGADAGITYSSISGTAFSANTTVWAAYQQTITITYYNGTNASASSTSGTRYFNTGNYINPTFTISPAAMSGWSFRGWSTSSAATAGITYSSISGTAFSASTTLYSAYQRTLTLSYNGNSATSGSTAASTGTQYYNKGNYSNPAVSVRANGFARTGYTFSTWRLGSTSGTVYNAGASITLTANQTMYATWTTNAFNINPWDSSITWTHSQPNGNGDYGKGVNNDRVWVSAKKTGGNYAFGRYTSSAINTKGCNRCRLTFTVATSNDWSESGYLAVNGSGVHYAPGDKKMHEFTISGNTATVIIQAQEKIGWESTTVSLWMIEFYNR